MQARSRCHGIGWQSGSAPPAVRRPAADALSVLADLNLCPEFLGKQKLCTARHDLGATKQILDDESAFWCRLFRDNLTAHEGLSVGAPINPGPILPPDNCVRRHGNA